MENAALLGGKVFAILLFTWLIGAAAQGVFTLFLATYSVLTVAVLVGFDTGNNYFGARARRPVQRAALMGSSILLTAFVGPVAIGIVFAVRHLTGLLAPLSETGILLLYVDLPLGLFGLLCGAVLFGRDRFGIRLIGTVVHNVIFAGGLLYLAVLGDLTIDGGLIWWSIGLGACTTYWFAYALFDAKRLPFLHRRFFVKQWRYGIRAYPYFVMNAANFRLDNFFISGYLGVTALGIYSVAVAAVEVILYLPRSLANATLTHHAADQQKSVAMILRPLAAFCLILFPLFLVASPLVILIFFSAEFVPAAWISLILLPGIFAMAIGVVGSYGLFARSENTAASSAAGYGVVFTVVLNLTLIPLFGISGAAMATTLSYVAFCVIVLRRTATLDRTSIGQLLQPDWSAITQLVRRVSTR
eukprot:s1_g1464.t1